MSSIAVIDTIKGAGFNIGHAKVYDLVTRRQVWHIDATDTGLDKMTSSRWQAIASIPEDVFEKFVRGAVESGKELTKAAALWLAKSLKAR